jgi:hypothetical protein
MPVSGNVLTNDTAVQDAPLKVTVTTRRITAAC